MKGASAMTVVGGLGGTQFVTAGRGWQDAGLTVRQGDTCVEVEPLDGQDDIVDLYGYSGSVDAENPRQANLPSPLEEPRTSRLFFFDGPEGLSLVFLQGGDDDPGGAATFFVCGLPSAGDWVVLDDYYGGATDEFLLGEQEAVLNWAWGVAGRNDGAVFRGFTDQFCTTIRPAFGEEANLEPFNGDGGVTQWQFLSGDPAAPDVIDLEMDEPITLTTGACDERVGGCAMNTETVVDPLDAEVTFCCTTVTVDSAEYDRVRLNHLDGTEQLFEGPFEGLNAFMTETDDDGNPNDEIIRSVTIEAGVERLKVENANFDRCPDALEGDRGDDGSAY